MSNFAETAGQTRAAVQDDDCQSWHAPMSVAGSIVSIAKACWHYLKGEV